MLGLDLHSWEQLMLLSLGIAGLVAIAVFITTASVVILQRRENTQTKLEFEAYKLDAGTKISTANASAAEANEEAARANERTAQIYKSLQPRQLTEAQAITLGDDLKGKISTLVVAYSEGDSGTLAWEIWHALRRVGITVWMQYVPSPSTNSGLQLVDDDPVRTELLIEAFNKLGFGMSWTKTPHMQANQPQNSLYIGSKSTP